MTETDTGRARLVGVNHVALEVGDIEEALEFYRSIFDFELRGQGTSSAFIDMGDQFLALSEVDHAGNRCDEHRHFGLVVDDASVVEQRLAELDIDRVSSSSLEFYDPWGNLFQIVEYEVIQFTKADHILRGMGLSHLEKSESAIEELAAKGLAPD